LPGKSSVSVPEGLTIAHELGHNLNLQHAPCGDPDDVDRSFPQPDGSIGAWGYDLQVDELVPPTDFDLMSYCGPQWISDYHFIKALRYRSRTAGRGRVEFSALVATSERSLLLWGGEDAGGVPFLEPAFVVDAPPSLPRATGDHEIVGQTAAGDELFSVAFEMREVADGYGRSSFAFTLPLHPGWADELASITLSGPGGSVTLDEGTDRPVTILRNPRTGQIRGILRERPSAILARDTATSALVLDEGLEVLTSRGLPDPEDWSR
ncbi:MAG: M66 family metalloprotease, partial [Candidatus Aminicenantes bacterium]|nr:M66 family metalloprotease [Candidatus Aminicenantes bacterium]